MPTPPPEIISESPTVPDSSLNTRYSWPALQASGASVKVAQELARHSDPMLALAVHTNLGVHDLTEAIEALPALTSDPPDAERQQLAAAGTDHARAELASGSLPKTGLRSSPSTWEKNRGETRRRGATTATPTASGRTRVSPCEMRR